MSYGMGEVLEIKGISWHLALDDIDVVRIR
jgi:hypothetical protein